MSSRIFVVTLAMALSGCAEDPNRFAAEPVTPAPAPPRGDPLAALVPTRRRRDALIAGLPEHDGREAPGDGWFPVERDGERVGAELWRDGALEAALDLRNDRPGPSDARRSEGAFLVVQGGTSGVVAQALGLEGGCTWESAEVLEAPVAEGGFHGAFVGAEHDDAVLVAFADPDEVPWIALLEALSALFGPTLCAVVEEGDATLWGLAESGEIVRFVDLGRRLAPERPYVLGEATPEEYDDTRLDLTQTEVDRYRETPLRERIEGWRALAWLAKVGGVARDRDALIVPGPGIVGIPRWTFAEGE